MTIEFRTATPDDAAAIARVLEVFSSMLKVTDHKATDHQELRLQQIRTTAHKWRIGVQANEIIAVAQASPSDVWFGRSRIKWADIGDVSVLASRQGEGIGSLAMIDMVRWLREKNFGMSRLGGLIRFYSRFGYEPFPRCYVEFPVSESIRAGASEVPFASLLTPAFPDKGVVRLFDEARDIPYIWDVMEQFTSHRTGCRAWERVRSTPDDMRDFLVYESSGRARGIMHFREFEADVSPNEASLMIYQLAYEPGCAAALDALIKHVLQRANEKKATRVTAYMPLNDDVIHDLQSIGVSYTLCEIMGAVAGNMLQIGNLRALLEQVQPELKQRIASLQWNGNIKLDTGDQQATLRIKPGQIEICEPVETKWHLRISHAELCRMVLGVLPPVWPRLVNPSDEIWPVLNAMFPPVRGGYSS